MAQASAGATPKTLRGRSVLSVRACKDATILGDACMFAGVDIPSDLRRTIPHLQRELIRRLVATAVIRAFPNEPAAEELDNQF